MRDVSTDSFSVHHTHSLIIPDNCVILRDHYKLSCGSVAKVTDHKLVGSPIEFTCSLVGSAMAQYLMLDDDELFPSMHSQLKLPKIVRINCNRINQLFLRKT